MAQLLRSDGTFEYVKPLDGTEFTLEELQKLVGGYIEIKKLHSGQFLVIDEEGKIKDKPVNLNASKLFNALPYDYIVGDAVLCSSAEVT